jgi:hypothetical protein
VYQEFFQQQDLLRADDDNALLREARLVYRIALRHVHTAEQRV